jgi:hypothetical protein
LLLFVVFEPRTSLTNRMRRLYHRLLSLLQILDNPPPQLMLSWNILFFDDDPEDYPGRDLFAVMSDRRLQFYDATGETLETFSFDLLMMSVVQTRQITAIIEYLLRSINKRK